MLSAFCAVLLACSIGLFGGISSRAQTAADLANSSKTIKIDELTQKGYNSSTNPNAVFDRDKLTALYSARTGGTGTTLQAGAKTVTGTHSTQYGYKVKTNLPEYKSALDLYTLNGNKNIVVNFGGQEWTVTFLTKDKNGDVIATLWMTQPLKDNSNTVIKSQFGWATGEYSSTDHTPTAVKYISNAYSTSKIRMTVLNGGNPDGSATQYAWNTSNASVTSLTGAVSSNDRKNNVLSAFTLNNSALTGTANANKSLINYITQPFDVEYTYSLDWVYANGSNTNDGYFINDALTRDASGAEATGKLSTVAGTTSTTIGPGTGKYGDCAWYSQGVKNYAYSAVNHYNDWGADYVWLPSICEVGRKYSSTPNMAKGLWETYSTGTDQAKFNNGSLNYDSTNILSASTNSSEYVWSRSSSPTIAYYVQFWSSSSIGGYGYPAASLGIRPALHLNLTAAEGSSCLKASDISTTTAYDNATEKPVTYNGSQHTLSYLKPDWYTDLSKYYTDSDRVELTYEFIKQGDTTTTFDTPALGKDGITASLKVDPTVVTNLVDAGKYKITIKLKDSSLFWDDDDLDYDDPSTT